MTKLCVFDPTLVGVRLEGLVTVDMGILRGDTRWIRFGAGVGLV